MIVIFAVIPFISAALYELMHWSRKIDADTYYPVLLQPNPYVQMFYNTEKLFSPNNREASLFLWQLNCAIMMAASIGLLLFSTVLVRRYALRQVTGQLLFSSGRKKNKWKKYGTGPQEPYVKIRTVKDPPVIWKEFRLPLLGRHKIIAAICTFLILSLLIFIYWLCAKERVLTASGVQITFVMVFLVLGIMFTIVLTSTGITTEKESRSWPILLTTTLDDKQILLGKYVWILLFAHIIIFSLSGTINPVALIQITILVAWIVTFLFCTGVYFSSRFKHTTTAVIVNLIFAVTIWILMPILFLVLEQFIHITNISKYAEIYVDTNPFLHAYVIIATNTNSRAGNYDWASFNANAFMSTLWMLACLAGYIFVGLIFAWRAQCRFRKNIF